MDSQSTKQICNAVQFSSLVNLHLESSMFRERKDFRFLFDDNDTSNTETCFQSLHVINKLRIAKKQLPFTVNVENGKDVIILEHDNGETKVDKLPTLPSLQTIYNTLMKAHLKDHHPSTIDLKKKFEFSFEYPLPYICFDLILSFCGNCSAKPNKPLSATTKGSVCFIYQMNTENNSFLTTLMIYMDVNTEYLFLRPVTRYVDIVNELFKIFLQVGMPQEVNVNHKCRYTFQNIKNKMKLLFPDCVVYSDQSEDEHKYLTRMVMDAMCVWLREADSKIWELGCTVIQNKINNTVRTKLPGLYSSCTPVTSFDLFFRNPAIFEHSSSRWFPGARERCLHIVDSDNPHVFRPYKENEPIPVNLGYYEPRMRGRGRPVKKFK